MKKHNAKNERIKREYFTYLKEAKRQSEQSVDAVAKALARFEAHTKYRDFNTFRREQAISFKRHLVEQKSEVTGKTLSKSTVHSTLSQLKRFFEWLAWRPGFKSKVQFSDAEYFNLSENDARVATARREQKFPTVEQVIHTIKTMPTSTVIELRNRAVLAFTLLAGPRDTAMASMKLKHVDLDARAVYQDSREVKTKFGKTFTTYFFPVGDEVVDVVANWVAHLRQIELWGNDDPLFPATSVELDSATRRYRAAGLKRSHWTTAKPIRQIFRDAFVAAGLPYYNPHSLRNTLVQLGETICRTPEDFKAWSQNLGHQGVLTTFYSYGEVPQRRQGEIIQALGPGQQSDQPSADAIAEAVVRKLAAGKETAPGC